MSGALAHTHTQLTHRAPLTDTGSLLDAVAGHLSARTRAEYLRDLRLFARWYAPGEAPEKALYSFFALDSWAAHDVVAQYRQHLRAAGQKPASINRKLSALRAVANALWAKGAAKWRLDLRGEPNRTDPRERIAKRLPAVSLDGIQKVLSAAATPATHSPEGLRDALIGALMGMAGLRRIEIQRLTWGALVGDTLHVLGKGGKERSVPLAPQVLSLWHAYAGALLQLGISTAPEAPVFVVLGKHAPRHMLGRALSLAAINAIANKSLGAAGAKRKGISCHALRHAFATVAAQHAPIHQLAAHLGHSNIATTGLYAHALRGANLSALVAAQVAPEAPKPTEAPQPKRPAAKPAPPQGAIIRRK